MPSSVEGKKTALGLALARMREGRGFSQRDLSLQAGLAEGYVSQIESGDKKHNPRRATIESLALAMHATREEQEELLRLAGRLRPGERLVQPGRPTLEVFLQGDPDLTSEQRQALIRTYHLFIRSNRGQESLRS